MPAKHLSFSVPGRVTGVTLYFDTEAAAPLTDLRFVFGGKQEIFEITFVQSVESHDVQISFDPPASPHEATVFFAQNPASSSWATAFYIFVNNRSTQDEELQITAIYH